MVPQLRMISYIIKNSTLFSKFILNYYWQNDRDVILFYFYCEIYLFHIW